MPGPLGLFFGNTPPNDILNLKDNEGSTYESDLALLWAAAGDPRSVIKTVNSLPDSFQQKLDIVINSFDENMVLRNFVILLLALSFPGGEAAEAILHIWYSAKLTKPIADIVEDRVTCRIRKTCWDIRREARRAIITTAWAFEKSSLKVTLPRFAWEDMLNILTPDPNFTFRQHNRIMDEYTMPTPKWIEGGFIDLKLAAYYPRHRELEFQYRRTGVLLPYGMSRDTFDTPNLTFYNSCCQWIVDPFNFSDVLEGCNLKDAQDYAKSIFVPKNDVYAAFFYHRRQMISEFCAKLCKHSVHFTLCSFLPQNLKTKFETLEPWISKDMKFDRIDLSDIVESPAFNFPELLSSVGQLLRSNAENTHATMLTEFNNVYLRQINDENFKIQIPLEKKLWIDKTFMKKLPEAENYESLRALEATWMLAHWNGALNTFCRENGFAAHGERAGLVMKGANTVVKRMPGQVEWDQEPEELERELELRIGHGQGWETYLEWKRDDLRGLEDSRRLLGELEL